MYIVIAIIAFGILIAIHEFGHFISAKLCGVKVNEFAIGMGPKLFGKQGKETLYSLRALPFGGFCAMEGQDEGTGDARAFVAQKRWRRVIILVAGSAANFIAAFILIVILTSGENFFRVTTITDLSEDFPNKGVNGLMVGDTIHSINGERLYYLDDFSTFMQLARSGHVDLVIRRDGERIKLDRFPLERRVVLVDGEPLLIDGQPVLRYGITFDVIEATPMGKFKYSCYTAFNFVRLIRVSIAQLVGGGVSIQDFSGPVGIIDAMNTIGQDAAQRYGFAAALRSIVFFTAFIGVNLAVMNLLPIPALDGGRIVFILISWVVEKIIRRDLDPKYEGYVHTGAFVLLIGFMVFILVQDVVKLVSN